jgi:hypothetical protein
MTSTTTEVSRSMGAWRRDLLLRESWGQLAETVAHQPFELGGVGQSVCRGYDGGSFPVRFTISPTARSMASFSIGQKVGSKADSGGVAIA